MQCRSLFTYTLFHESHALLATMNDGIKFQFRKMPRHEKIFSLFLGVLVSFTSLYILLTFLSVPYKRGTSKSHLDYRYPDYAEEDYWFEYYGTEQDYPEIPLRTHRSEMRGFR